MLGACNSPSPPQGDNSLVPRAPLQEQITPFSFDKGDVTLTAVAKYSVEALILGKENYYWNEGASLSPTDLALGWQSMSNPSIIDSIQISQGSRFYRWYAVKLPLPRHSIETQSANVHLIPSSPEVAAQIALLKKGQHVTLEGYLVNAKKGGRFWKTSLTRSDTGAGACELLWVEAIYLH